MKKFHILDVNTMAMGTKYFAISASKPNMGSGYVQIAYLSQCPTVNAGSFAAATMADRLKAPVGLQLDMRFAGLGGNLLVDNFDSTKGEIRCYTEFGHRRPPFDKVVRR
jgi:hypothetical protein